MAAEHKERGGDAEEPPHEFICPITGEIFVHPVVAADGNTYERDAIARWFRRKPTSPLTNLPLSSLDLVPNLNMEKLIADFVEAVARPRKAHAHGSAAQPPDPAPAAEAGAPTSLMQLNWHCRDLDLIREQLAKTLEGWEPPVIVVVGDESSGKSTVLERLAWMSLFPKGDELCTRLPILVSLRCSAQPVPPTLRVMNGDEVVSEEQFDSPDCQEVVRSTMLRVIENENKRVSGISRCKQLHLNLSGPRLPNLDLLDVPGLVANRRGDDPETIRQDTHGLVNDVIRRYKDRAVFLAVRSIKDQTISSLTVSALNQNKDILKSTLGVFTKCDREFPEEIRSMLANPGLDLGYGYVATSNKPGCAGLNEQDEKEKTLFKEQGLSDLVQSKSATSHVLVERIEHVYVEYLAREWIPKTLQLLGDKKRELDEKDREMGLPRAHETVSRELAIKVSQTASAVVAAARDGQVSRSVREIVIPLKAGMIGVMENAGNDWIPVLEYNARRARALSELKRLVRKAIKDLVQSMSRKIEEGLRNDRSPVRVSRFPHFIDGLVQKLAMTFDPHVATLQSRAMQALESKFTQLVEPELNLEFERARLVSNPKQRIADVVCHCLVSYSSSIASIGVEDIDGLAATLITGEECREERVAMLGEMHVVDTLHRKLSEMRVRGGGGGESKEDDGASAEKAWANLVGVTTTKLDLEGKIIGDAGMAALAKVLPQCTALTYLDLDKNEITDAGAAALAKVLPQCQALSKLYLQHNRIGDSGCEALAKALPRCQTLSRLYLASNRIGDSGGRALAELLPQCRALSRLVLSCNQIGDSGAETLANVLPLCKALTKLYLDSNVIGNSGAKTLACALPLCQALSQLHLRSNQIGDFLRSELDELHQIVENGNGKRVEVWA